MSCHSLCGPLVGQLYDDHYECDFDDFDDAERLTFSVYIFMYL